METDQNIPDATIEDKGDGFTRTEWRKFRRVSRNKFYTLIRQGRAPKEIKLGRLNIITREADAEWKRARDNPDEAEQKLLAKEAEDRKRSCQKATAASLKSPRHISKTRKADAAAKRAKAEA